MVEKGFGDHTDLIFSISHISTHGESQFFHILLPSDKQWRNKPSDKQWPSVDARRIVQKIDVIFE